MQDKAAIIVLIILGYGGAIKLFFDVKQDWKSPGARWQNFIFSVVGIVGILLGSLMFYQLVRS